jgi:hypothetical protein
MVYFSSWLLLYAQPQPQLLQLPEQLLESGQPIHFLPLFLACIMYATAPPTKAPTIATAITVESTGPITRPPFLLLLALFYSS